ncbi:MFS transporter [Shewanella alkalitolerans]|uniref:MFS transporter n=1 Tax=Shewanella alkalitolerans TaxID=2864209 RepID=UPI001C654F09|nr:MFS transporter [Shewanella alkalitolerans]QYJ98874.1 MFS transporter [Shewanella alkalitolerans]
MSPSNYTNWRSWVAVFMLGIASFTIVTTELAPIGMLSSIAQDMQQSASSTGLVVTLYAWLSAAVALISVMMISHLPRRPLLVGLMLLLGGVNGVAAVSQSFSVLLAARVVGALAHGAFWAMIGTLGAQLVSESSVGKATAIIFGGVSIASVLGVPLINWISSGAGWRLSFLILGILSVVTALTLVLSLPHVSGTPRLGRGELFSVFRNSKLRIVYLIAACGIVSHFAAFTYVEVLLSSVIALPNSWISICLLTFGVAGIVGNFMCGMYIDNHLKRVLSTGLLLISLCLTLISLPTVSSKVITLLLVSGWGLGVAHYSLVFKHGSSD